MKTTLIIINCLFLLFFTIKTNLFSQNEQMPPVLIQQPPVGPPAPPPPQGIAPAPPPAQKFLPQQPSSQILQPTPPATTVLSQQTFQNFLKKLPEAVLTASKIIRFITPGNVWIMKAPMGEIEIKAGLIYKENVIGVLHFNPFTGDLMPEGFNVHTYQTNISLMEIKNKLSTIISQLKIITATRFLEPEACWKFPIVYKNMIVSHFKIYYDGIHIIPDYPAQQEMTIYGK